MKKRGLLLKIFLIVIIAIILIIAGTAIYFYQFHTFEEIRICISEGEITETNQPCETKEDCIDYFQKEIPELQDFDLENLPASLQDKKQELIDKALICDTTCKYKKIETTTTERTTSCLEGEEEISIEIRGKEGLEILKNLRK